MRGRLGLQPGLDVEGRDLLQQHGEPSCRVVQQQGARLGGGARGVTHRAGRVQVLRLPGQ